MTDRDSVPSQSEIISTPPPQNASLPPVMESRDTRPPSNSTAAKHRVVMDALGGDDDSSDSFETDEEMATQEHTKLQSVPTDSANMIQLTKPTSLSTQVSSNLANISRELHAKKKVLQVPSATLRLDKHYIIDPEKYTYFRGYLRQDWHTVKREFGGEIEELHATWLELFFDLIFVATIVRVSIEVSKEPDPVAFVFPFAQFLLLYLCWADTVAFTTRFSARQRLDQLMQLIYMVGVLTMGLSISTKKQAKFGQLYFLMYLFTRGGLFGLYLKASLIPRATLLCRIYMGIAVTQAIIAIIIAFTAKTVPWQLGCCIALILFSHLSGDIFVYWPNKDARIPVNVPHMAERLGLFVMLVMGEAIISIVTGKLDLAEYSYAGVGASFLTLYLLQSLYFDSQPSEESVIEDSKSHAMRKSKCRGKTYWIMHYLIVLALLAYGVGNKTLIDHIRTKEKEIDVLLISYSLVVIIIGINGIRVAHPFKVRHRKTWVFRIFVMVSLAVLPAFWYAKVPFGPLVGVGVFLIFLLVASDEESKSVRAEEKLHEKHKIKHAEHEKAEREKMQFEQSRTQTQTPQFEQSRTQTSTAGAEEEYDQYF